MIIFVSRLINLEDGELREQYFEELKKLEGKGMRELTWIEERFRDEAIAFGRNEGRIEGRSEAVNAAIDFMRSNGMSNEQINAFRSSIQIS